METKGEIAKAILTVMKAVKGIDKSMTIGKGDSAYKGVPDQEVKKVIGEAMSAAGLCILPIGVEAKTKIDRWDEVDPWSKETPKATKSKQSVFTETKTRYLLLHESGESIELEGYGQGVDSQDKSAGKATTYALKYTLLYTFMVPTGKIDDADTDHSDEHPVPEAKPTTEMPKESDNRPWLNEVQLKKAIDRIKSGEPGVFEKMDKAFKMKKEFRNQLKAA